MKQRLETYKPNRNLNVRTANILLGQIGAGKSSTPSTPFFAGKLQARRALEAFGPA